MMQDLFVYGTLQFPEILKKLTGKTFSLKPATLVGYKRSGIKGCDYPAIISTPGSVTEGLVIKNVDARSLKIIDFFEGEEYEKKEVVVISDEKEKTAITYIWRAESHLLLEQDWDLKYFEMNFLATYLK